MKLKLKEDPKEWRKAALLSALGLTGLSTLLRWRHILPAAIWIVALAMLATIMLAACLHPRLFRGYYRLSSRISFGISQFFGRLVLAIFFILVLTPLGLVLRLCGKDLLRLKRPPDAATYWNKTKNSGPLDRLF
jgi:Saxitoxin biosynthesis operon protein SxtJ